jgi:hypothetical protein
VDRQRPSPWLVLCELAVGGVRGGNLRESCLGDGGERGTFAAKWGRGSRPLVPVCGSASCLARGDGTARLCRLSPSAMRPMGSGGVRAA